MLMISSAKSENTDCRPETSGILQRKRVLLFFLLKEKQQTYIKQAVALKKHHYLQIGFPHNGTQINCSHAQKTILTPCQYYNNPLISPPAFPVLFTGELLRS